VGDIPKQSHVHVHGNDVFSLCKILIEVGCGLRLVPVRLQTHAHAHAQTSTQTRAKEQKVTLHRMQTCMFSCARAHAHGCAAKGYATLACMQCTRTHAMHMTNKATTAERGAERSREESPLVHVHLHKNTRPTVHTHKRQRERDHINKLELVREACVAGAKSRPCRYVFLFCFFGNNSPTSDISHRSSVCPPPPPPSHLPPPLRLSLAHHHT
jgi:hypothetical protein